MLMVSLHFSKESLFLSAVLFPVCLFVPSFFCLFFLFFCLSHTISSNTVHIDAASQPTGTLYASTESFTTSFLFSGFLITLGGLICIPVRRIARWEARKEQQKKDKGALLSKH